jgi:hypothetical protein
MMFLFWLWLGFLAGVAVMACLIVAGRIDG